MNGFDKSEVRRQNKGIRDSIAASARRELSNMICDSIRENELYQKAKLIYFYAPCGSEVDISPLYEEILSLPKNKRTKRVAFPKVKPDDKSMVFYEVNSLDELAAGYYGVLEPETSLKPVDGELGLIIVPGVGFDKKCSRMGYGGGFYDRYLGKYSGLVKIGVCFDLQVLKCDLPQDKYDVPVDFLITNQECYERHYDYESIVNYINSVGRFHNASGVTISSAVMDMLGHPERKLKYIHVAGTNGKGSVCAYMTEILLESGIKPGVFTSPHLSQFNERIAIGHEMISDEDIFRIARELVALDHMLCVTKGYRMTMFDYCFAMAIKYFVEKQVEYVVLETGLGGKLDSTNCIPTPVVSIITAIGLEHTAQLGNTLGEIAYQKAGILKPGTIAVIMPQENEAMDVLCDECRRMDIPFFVGVDLPNGVSPSMRGNYQYMNAATAREAALQLSRTVRAINDDAIAKGITKAYLPGRMEIICDLPLVVLDCAHNPHGVRAMVDSLKTMYPGEKFVFYMGVMSDKNYDEMIDPLQGIADIVYTVKPNYSRAFSQVDLSEKIRAKGIKSRALQSTQVVMDQIRGAAVDTKSVVFGSIYLIGEIRDIIML